MVADLSWVVVAYLLASTVAAPLYGYIGDRVGRRRALLGALVEWARTTGTKVVPLRPFAKAQFGKDASIRDVLV